MKLRSACDVCHHAKVKCSGGRPCENCCRYGGRCVYSAASKQGRPRGARNKATIERLQRTISQPPNFEPSAVTTQLRNDIFDFSAASIEPCWSPYEIGQTSASHDFVCESSSGLPSPRTQSSFSPEPDPSPFSQIDDFAVPSESPRCRCLDGPLEIHQDQGLISLQLALAFLRQANARLENIRACEACQTTPGIDRLLILALQLRSTMRRLRNSFQKSSTHPDGPDWQTSGLSFDSPRPSLGGMTQDEQCLVKCTLLESALGRLTEIRNVLENRSLLLGADVCHDILSQQPHPVPHVVSFDRDYLRHILQDIRQFSSESPRVLR